jgi:hypothetical protein
MAAYMHPRGMTDEDAERDRGHTCYASEYVMGITQRVGAKPLSVRMWVEAGIQKTETYIENHHRVAIFTGMRPMPPIHIPPLNLNPMLSENHPRWFRYP